MIAVTTIGAFFTQVLPGVMGEGVRAWLLVRLGCDWRNALTSVVIDRGIGVGLLLALGFVILLLPSGLTALGGYRQIVLVVYGVLLLAGVLGLLLVPTIAPLLERWRYSRWIATLAVDARRVLLGPQSPIILSLGCLVHALTIIIVWSLGRAQGLVLPVADAAVLFTVMVGVALVPISVGGWGLRELAVVSLLGRPWRGARACAAVFGVLRPGLGRLAARGFHMAVLFVAPSGRSASADDGEFVRSSKARKCYTSLDDIERAARACGTSQRCNDGRIVRQGRPHRRRDRAGRRLSRRISALEGIHRPRRESAVRRRSTPSASIISSMIRTRRAFPSICIMAT